MVDILELAGNYGLGRRPHAAPGSSARCASLRMGPTDNWLCWALIEGLRPVVDLNLKKVILAEEYG